MTPRHRLDLVALAAAARLADGLSARTDRVCIEIRREFAGGDPEGGIDAALGLLRQAQDDLNALTAVTAGLCRQAGLSWAEVGDRLGITKQAAWERYGAGRAAAAAEDRLSDPLF